MATNYMKLFDGVERDKAQKFLDYYDGRGDVHLQTYINTRRSAAVDAGMVPFTRNLTKMIVDKSAMLFKGTPPSIKVYNKGTRDLNEAASAAAQKAFEDAGWIEYFNNFDAIVRMTKSALTYVQIVEDEETKERKFVLTALSQANAAAHFTPSKKIDTLVYFQGKAADGTDMYSLVTPKNFADISVMSIGGRQIDGEEVTNVIPNPYGTVTAVAFHDTNLPFRGNWNPIPTDLVGLNFNYDIAITDTNYSSIWSKFPTLYSNVQTTDGALVSNYDETKSKFASRNSSKAGGFGGLIGGPNRVVGIETSAGETPYIEYKVASPDLGSLQAIMDSYFRAFAEDWSVMVTSDNEGGMAGVASGFALQVREIPNMELRQKRARMFEQGFKRLYEIMLKMSEKMGMGLVQDTELFVEFAAPELPVDETAAEAIWSRRIKEGRSSDVEYFMVEQGLTREEAQAKVKLLAEDRALLREVNGATPATSAAPQTGSTTDVVI